MRTMLAAAVLACLLPGAALAAEPRYEGVWFGTMTCPDGERALILDLEVGFGGGLTAALEFGDREDHFRGAHGGKEALTGRIEAGRMRLTAWAWDRPSPSGALISLDGQLGVDSFEQVATLTGLASGDGCGRFDLRYSPLNDLTL